MTALYNDNERSEILGRIKKIYLSFAVGFVITAAICAFSVIFWQQITRFWAQLTATLTTAIYGCYLIYFISTISILKKQAAFIGKIPSCETETLQGIVTRNSLDETTLNGFTYFNFTLKNSLDERVFYIRSNETLPKIGQKLTVDCYGMYLTGIEFCSDTENAEHTINDGFSDYVSNNVSNDDIAEG